MGEKKISLPLFSASKICNFKMHKKMKKITETKSDLKQRAFEIVRKVIGFDLFSWSSCGTCFGSVWYRFEMRCVLFFLD